MIAAAFIAASLAVLVWLKKRPAQPTYSDRVRIIKSRHWE